MAFDCSSSCSLFFLLLPSVGSTDLCSVYPIKVATKCMSHLFVRSVVYEWVAVVSYRNRIADPILIDTLLRMILLRTNTEIKRQQNNIENKRPIYISFTLKVQVLHMETRTCNIFMQKEMPTPFSFHKKDLEYSQSVDKVMNTLRDERILDLEIDTSINGHTLQNHTSVLGDLTGKLFIKDFQMLRLDLLALR